MTADLLITGARISDGTGLPAFTGDVEVRDGRIARVGNLRGVAADKVIDACGLDLVPGFVDIHTHYDAQLYFEPTASPSSWHGVTTVITGNCGFAIAPSKPEDVEWLVLMLAKVEGMSADALFAGVPFRGGSWGDFVDPYAGRIGVNVASYVGHSAVRRWVMGAAASEREATSDEIRAMQAVVDTAMRQGALGFSTSQLDVHADHEGRPVPSNLAAPEELVALSAVLADYDQGVLQNLCRTFAIGYDQSDRALLADMVRASGNKPMHANMLQRFTNDPDIWRTCLGILEGYAREGLRIYPMASANPKGLHLSLADTGMLDEMPIFREVLVLPKDERVRRLQDHATRDRMRDEFANAPRQLAFDWTQLLVASTRDAANTAWTGRSVAELALERNADPLDTFIDLSLLEDLETVFAIDRPVTKEDREVIRYLLAHPLAMPGSSDGGAHVNTFCGADYTTRVRRRRVHLRTGRTQAVGSARGIARAVGSRRDPPGKCRRHGADRPHAARGRPRSSGARLSGRRGPHDLGAARLRIHHRQRTGDRRRQQAHRRHPRRARALQSVIGRGR
jgi:N-acyl-D-aspartate/D-glutamate deacylase